MRKHVLIVILLMGFSLLSQTQKYPAKAILDTVIERSKTISFYTDQVDWNALSTQIYQAGQHATQLDELKPALEILFNGLRDHHAQARRATDYSILAHFTDYSNSRKKDQRPRDQKIRNIINNTEARFQYALLPDNIGYLKVVGVGPNVNPKQEATRIREAIETLNAAKVKGWILDLRYNGGGNANVMMSGLEPLFDADKVLTIRSNDGTVLATAEFRDGQFWYYGGNAIIMKESPKIDNPKIAVLLSRWTVSSGEFVAVAFKGQNNSRFFGEFSGGYITNNSWEPVNGELFLAISTGVYADRNGTVYNDYVGVDVPLTFTVTDNLSEDREIIEAISWLIDN